MKGKFDFANALVRVAFLPGDLDHGKLGLRSVDEIHTHRDKCRFSSVSLWAPAASGPEIAENSI